MRVLVVTVGGSPDPICTAVQTLSPGRVVFLCSTGKHGSRRQVDGPGEPCEIRGPAPVLGNRPNLVRQLGLREDQVKVVELSDLDDPGRCYAEAARVLDELRAEDGVEVVADYTGGTKTMSVALAAAALDREVPLYLTTRERSNLQRVEFDQYTELAETSAVHAHRALDVWLPSLVECFDYAGAVRLLKGLGVRGLARGSVRQRVTVLRDAVSALEAWDRFDHAGADRLLSQQMRHPWVRELRERVARLLSARAELEGAPVEGGRHHGFELVQDLLLNAERRAAQGRFDDAVGRLYRALELLAQVHLLRAHGLRTGRLAAEAVPEGVREEVLRGKAPDKTGSYRVGLFDAYRILKGFRGDPVGDLFSAEEGRLQNSLEARNRSLFAHGFQPLSENEWREFQKTAQGFMLGCLRRVAGEDLPAQLPGPLPEVEA